MDKKWMPITAGVLDIIHGVGEILVGVFFIKVVRDLPWGGIYGTEEVILWLILIPIGVLAVVGGIHAFIRKRWPLALVGGIVTFILPALFMLDYWEGFEPRSLRDFFSSHTLLGFSGIPAIVAIILTVLSRKQFKRK